MTQFFRCLIFKINKYGFRGTLSAFCRMFQRDTPLHEAMLRMSKHQKAPPQRGITIIGDMSTHSSLPKVLCDLYKRLKECNIPCQCLDTTKPINNRFEILKYDHVVSMLQNPLPRKLRKRVITSVIVFWEFDSGVIDGYPQLVNGDRIIAMSDFNYDYFRQVLPANSVKKILYPFQFLTLEAEQRLRIRDKFNIPHDAFMVFFNFELGTKRKNPEAIIATFAKAFPDRQDVILVFKTMSVKRFPQHLSALHEQASSLGLGSRFRTIDAYLEDDEMNALTDACDVYVSLHRGEGFGLGIAEAMQIGKPVVVTDWSASTEFCNPETSIPIPYTFGAIAPCEFRALPYANVIRWAEPDVDAAASALRRLYDDPELRRRLGENGKKFINEHFSLENFKKSINAFLAY